MKSEEAMFKAIRSCQYQDLRYSLAVNIESLYLILTSRERQREIAATAERLSRTRAILDGICKLDTDKE